MFDRFNRRIRYLRISITDRCNLRCRYCMPENGVQLMRREDILTLEEIAEVAKTAVRLGIDKIRLTGGEPLIRKGVIDLVAVLAGIPGVKDLALTTNGVLLKQMAAPLKAAGLHRVNVSLDAVDPERYRQITRGGELADVLAGIRAARDAGLDPIKINCVVFASSREADAAGVREYARRESLQVRFIRQMNLETGEFSVVEGGDGGNCSRCNRLRLTANGLIKPCLFDDQGFAVRELGAERALISAVQAKPMKGNVNITGKFYNLGG